VKIRVAACITLTGKRNLSLLSLRADMSFANDITSFCKRCYPSRKGEKEFKNPIVDPFWKAFYGALEKYKSLGGGKKDMNRAQK